MSLEIVIVDKALSARFAGERLVARMFDSHVIAEKANMLELLLTISALEHFLLRVNVAMNFEVVSPVKHFATVRTGVLFFFDVATSFFVRRFLRSG